MSIQLFLQYQMALGEQAAAFLCKPVQYFQDD